MNIRNNIFNIKKQIYSAAIESNRSVNDITLLAVSKNRSCSDILKAIDAGQLQFGENYVKEGLEKIKYFYYKKDLVWHFIGLLQSNKTKFVAEHFDWFHSLDRECIAKRLNDQRPHNKNKLNVLIQVNINDKYKECGVSLNEINILASKIVSMPNLLLRGLMIIPALENTYEKQYNIFYKLKSALKLLKLDYPALDTLSMGMTDDIKAAIHCGSTIVRIGRGIFGSCNIKKDI